MYNYLLFMIISIILLPSPLAPPFLSCSTTLRQAAPGLQHCKSAHVCVCMGVYVNASKGKSKWVPHHLPPLQLHFHLHLQSFNFICTSTTRPRQPLYSDCAPYTGATCLCVCVCWEMENIIFHKF